MQEGDVFKTKSYGDLIITKYINSQAVCVKFVVTGYETTTQANQHQARKCKKQTTTYCVRYRYYWRHSS